MNPDFKLEAGKTDYAINSLDNNASETFACQVPLGKQLWYGTRENGIRSDKSDSDQEIGVIRANPTSISLPRYNTTGTTNVISVLVGTKYDSNQNGTIDWATNSIWKTPMSITSP